MDAAEIDAVLEKACSTTKGELKAAFALSELGKLAPAFANEATRPAAEAFLQGWIEHGTPLKKGLATAWLAQARSQVASGIVHAAKATGAAFSQVEGKVGDLGAAAGDRFAHSKLNANAMATTRHAGGIEARGRLVERFQPRGATPQRFRADGTAMTGRSGPEAHPLISPVMEHVDRVAPRDAEAAVHPGAAAVQADALDGAYKAGADFAARAHAGQIARMGRIAAKHGFRAGAVAASVAAAGGAAAGLSEAQRRERSEAGKHSHDGKLGKAARFAVPAVQPQAGARA